MWQDFFRALALMLVIEGIMPFLNPGAWRRALQSAAGLGDASVRAFGLLAMLAGLVLLAAVR